MLANLTVKDLGCIRILFVLTSTHLTCSADATAVQRAGFGAGSGPIHLDDVGCVGTEPGLVNCTYDPVTTDCTHIEDAGVRCSLIRTSTVVANKIEEYMIRFIIGGQQFTCGRSVPNANFCST